MSWLGVPFASPEDWDGFDWTNIDFLNQFVLAAQDRLNAMRHVSGLSRVSLSLFQAGAPAQPAGFFNHLRRFGNYIYKINPVARNATVGSLGEYPLMSTAGGRWMDKDRIAVGQDFAGEAGGGGLFYGEDCFYFDNDGYATVALLERMNEILEDAGAAPIPEVPTDDASAMGIPWTRYYGEDPEDPEIDHGAAQEGDYIGPHIFNELWAFLMAMDCVHVPFGTIQGWNDGSHYEYSWLRWAEFQDVVAGSCSLIGGAPDSSDYLDESGILFDENLVFEVIRQVAGDDTEDWTTRGSSFARKITITVQKPDFEYGKTFFLFARHETVASPYVLTEFEATVAVGQISHVASAEDGDGTLTLVVGNLDNQLALAPACIDPASPDETRNDYFGQRFTQGYAALECEFPDPPH